jgi:3',5'-cyclic AMP phosphodiesterase CpdA
VSTSPGLTIMAAGDVCDPDPASCRGTADLIQRTNPDHVIELGDLQYSDGTAAQIAASYDTTWGAFKNKTLPVPGNHELRISDKDYCNYFGAAAHCPYRYYSTDFGKWRAIVLDGNAVGTLQLNWLEAELQSADAAGDNVLAAVHQPRWSSPCGGCHGSQSAMKPLWDKLVAHHADVILAAHDHRYERFAPMDGNGVAAGGTGIREFVVGTGGAHFDPSGGSIPGSQFVRGDFAGVLQLTLGDSSYSWKMLQDTGAVVDSGTESVNH